MNNLKQNTLTRERIVFLVYRVVEPGWHKKMLVLAYLMDTNEAYSIHCIKHMLTSQRCIIIFLMWLLF